MSARRRPVSGRTRALVIFLDRVILWLSENWLASFNVLAGLYAVLPLLAPILAAWGAEGPARAIYAVYSYVCHQQPGRSFFILGYQMAFCQRDIAIYGSIFVAGLCYAVTRHRWRPLPWWGVALLVLPATVDGSLQLFMTYESNWLLRVVSGALTGVAAVWFLYPRFDRAFVLIGQQAARQLERASMRRG